MGTQLTICPKSKEYETILLQKCNMGKHNIITTLDYCTYKQTQKKLQLAQKQKIPLKKAAFLSNKTKQNKTKQNKTNLQL